MAVFRLVGAIDAITVDLPGMGVRQIAVEGLVGVLGQLDTLQLDLACGIEQAQLDLGGIGREQGKVDAQAIPGGPKGEGQPFADALGVASGRC